MIVISGLASPCTCAALYMLSMVPQGGEFLSGFVFFHHYEMPMTIAVEIAANLTDKLTNYLKNYVSPCITLAKTLLCISEMGMTAPIACTNPTTPKVGCLS